MVTFWRTNGHGDLADLAEDSRRHQRLSPRQSRSISPAPNAADRLEPATWRVLFADIGEAVTYCPECAEREF
jgi:hypothetical protein